MSLLNKRKLDTSKHTLRWIWFYDLCVYKK